MDTRQYKGQNVRSEIKRDQRTKAYQDLKHAMMERVTKLESLVKDLKTECKRMNTAYEDEVERSARLAEKTQEFVIENGNLMVTIRELQTKITSMEAVATTA